MHISCRPPTTQLRHNHQNISLRPQLNSVLVFILTMLLLAADFYYLKNIAGRRLVGLRWWNEVDTSTGDSHWVFESQDRSGEGGGVGQNATDKRYVCTGAGGIWVGEGRGGEGGRDRGRDYSWVEKEERGMETLSQDRG